MDQFALLSIVMFCYSADGQRFQFSSSVDPECSSKFNATYDAPVDIINPNGIYCQEFNNGDSFIANSTQSLDLLCNTDAPFSMKIFYDVQDCSHSSHSGESIFPHGVSGNAASGYTSGQESKCIKFNCVATVDPTTFPTTSPTLSPSTTSPTDTPTTSSDSNDFTFNFYITACCIFIVFLLF